MTRTMTWLAASLALSALAARADASAALHDVLGDDPLARQIEQAPIKSVTWVQGAHGERVPLLLGQNAAAAPLAGAAGADAAAGNSLGGLAAQPSLAGLRDAVASKKSGKAPKQALKQAHHIQARRAW